MQFRLRLSLRQLLIQMARRPDLLCGAIVLSCTLILSVKFAYSRAKNVVSPARPPVRFFSPSAPIIDLYLGQLDQVERLRSNSDVTLIYFYAPWCGESISARVAIEQVAKKLSDQVQFIAINCWWNQGKCRKQKNFYYYPVIYVYYRRFGPIEYTGPFTAAYLEKFVRRVIAPLVYIPSEERLKKFLSHYEPGVLGYFEFNTSPQPPGYLTFLMSALQALKRDFQGVLRFGVITSRQLANRISLTSHGTVFMHRHFNTSLIFPRHALNFTSENICKWAYENLELFYRWLRPHGGKSRLMDKELKKGAALLVFLPFDPLAESQPQIDEDVLLFYYTQWCGFCSVLNHVLIQLAHFFQFNQMFTVSRINAAKNDLPWEYMVDRFPTILFFPSDRKHLSVKFPDAPINLPNLVRFVIRYSSRRSSSEVHGQAAPNPPTKAGSLQAQMVLLENDVHKLRREVHTLQLAKDQLSRQLSEVRHEKRQLTIHAHTLEKRNTELQLQGNELEKLYEQKKQELDDTVEKLQELADASENLLTENTLLKILMASMKEERKAALTETSSSSDEHLLEKSDSQREEL
ncbi:thioredoxin domain-containing protein 11 isoform X2 [Polypterus senegalus]|uniref:thioredoxin domain-containing protein 11 isoform X2 n=1 Tax=Polypterus senegalus TaxID=55291 RepID=UPI001965205A|nr:thioredoxin domain-containing protein 11 isoform X2 [Polypterus senegalus]